MIENFTQTASLLTSERCNMLDVEGLSPQVLKYKCTLITEKG